MFDSFSLQIGDIINAASVILAVFLGNWLMKLYDQRKDSAKKNKQRGAEEAENKAWKTGLDNRITNIEKRMSEMEKDCPQRHHEITAKLRDLQSMDAKYDQAMKQMDSAYRELKILSDTSRQHLTEILKVQTLYKEQLEHSGQVSELKMNRLEENLFEIKDSVETIVQHLNNMNGKVNRHENDLTKIKTKMNM
jgi:chromosome segregation ATPase